MLNILGSLGVKRFALNYKYNDYNSTFIFLIRYNRNIYIYIGSIIVSSLDFDYNIPIIVLA